VHDAVMCDRSGYCTGRGADAGAGGCCFHFRMLGPIAWFFSARGADAEPL
jgi:hypothetical protein